MTRPVQHSPGAKGNAAATKRYRERHPERQKAIGRRYREKHGSRNRAKRYGLEEHEVLAMFAGQDGRCDICTDPMHYKDVCVDHSHETGVVRALLCRLCNMGLGSFKDDPSHLMRAAQYLRKHAVAESKADMV